MPTTFLILYLFVMPLILIGEIKSGLSRIEQLHPAHTPLPAPPGSGGTASQVDVCAPVQLVSTALLGHTATREIYLRLTLHNVCDRPIIGLKLTARGYNAFGDPVPVLDSLSFPLLAQDLQIEAHAGGETGLLPLPDPGIRRVELTVDTVLLDTGEQWVVSEHRHLSMQYRALPQEDRELLRRESLPMRYQPAWADGWYLCSCGHLYGDAVRCPVCDLPGVKNSLQQQLRLNEQFEQRQQAEKKKKKRYVRVIAAVLALIILVVLIVSGL